MNAPNALTVARILLVPVVVVGLLGRTAGGLMVAGFAFGVAALTDVADGRLARSRSTVTSFGRVMDSVADKLLIGGALIGLVSLDRVAAWVAVVIIARELAVSLLRATAAQRGLVVSVSGLGKAKTVVQVAAVMALIAADPAALWVQALLYTAVAITLVSGADYFLGFFRQTQAAHVPATSSRPASRGVGGARSSR